MCISLSMHHLIHVQNAILHDLQASIKPISKGVISGSLLLSLVTPVSYLCCRGTLVRVITACARLVYMYELGSDYANHHSSANDLVCRKRVQLSPGRCLFICLCQSSFSVALSYLCGCVSILSLPYIYLKGRCERVDY